MSACVRSVYPYEPGPVSPWFHFTFVPSLLFVVILLALLLAAFGQPAEPVKGIGPRGHLKRRAHATIIRLGDGAPLVTLVIVLITSGATAFAWLTAKASMEGRNLGVGPLREDRPAWTTSGTTGR